MAQPLRDIQLFRNSDINTLTSYNDTVNRMTNLVTNDSDDAFKDGQIVLGRFRDGARIRTVAGAVSVSGSDKYIDFLTVRDDVRTAIEAVINALDGSAATAYLNNGTLVLKEVVQQDGAIGEGNPIVTLYLDTNMNSTNPLASKSTVDAKIAEERAKNYIDSSEYASGNPMNLTSSEIAALNQVYRVGHIVHDSATNRFYAWYGDGWGYPSVQVTTTTALAEFRRSDEILVLNDEPLQLEGGTLVSVFYAPVYGQPSDWATNWDKYYLWDMSTDEYYLNTSNVYDSTKVYHVKNITLL